MKSGHTVKKKLWEKRKWSEPTSDERIYKYPHHVSLNTAKPPLNELVFYDWMHFLVHNIMGDYLKRKKNLIFFFDLIASVDDVLVRSSRINGVYLRAIFLSTLMQSFNSTHAVTAPSFICRQIDSTVRVWLVIFQAIWNG